MIDEPNEIEPTVRRIVVDVAPKPPGRDVTSSDSLTHDLGYDSLRLLELAFALEDKFGMEPISAEDSAAIKTVGDVVGYIEEKVKNGGGRRPSQ